MPTVTIFPIVATNATLRVSANIDYSGSGSAILRILSDTWATDDPAIAVSASIEESFDAGVNWQPMCGPSIFHPGEWGKGGQPILPAMGCEAYDTGQARKLRALLWASATIQVGLSATV